MILHTFVHLISQNKYFLLIPAALLGGPIVSLLSGSLVRLGYLAIVPTYLCLMGGELIGDVLWYWIGYGFGERFVNSLGPYVGVTTRHIHVVKKLFHKYHDNILFLSKLTTGFGFAIVVLFTAGLARAPFWRYLSVNIVGQIIWSGVLLIIGFFLSHLFLQTASIILRILLLTIYLIMLILLLIFQRSLRKRISLWYEND